MDEHELALLRELYTLCKHLQVEQSDKVTVIREINRQVLILDNYQSRLQRQHKHKSHTSPYRSIIERERKSRHKPCDEE